MIPETAVSLLHIMTKAIILAYLSIPIVCTNVVSLLAELQSHDLVHGKFPSVSGQSCICLFNVGILEGEVA